MNVVGRKSPSLLDEMPTPETFRSTRRQRFLTAEIVSKNLAWTARSVDALTEAIDHHLKEGNDSPIGQRGIFIDLLNLFRLQYTAGRAIADLTDTFSAAMSRWCQWHLDYAPHARRVARDAGIALRDDATPMDFDDLEDFQEAMTLAGVAALLGSGDQLTAIADLLRRYQGEDMLFDALVAPIRGQAPGGTEYFHVDPYDPLIDAFYTAESPSEASAFVKRYLDNWYPAFNGCSWHDGHLVKKDHMSPYNGYWSFEAAAICVIHNIDDTSFRDHLVYRRTWPTGRARTARSTSCVRSRAPRQDVARVRAARAVSPVRRQACGRPQPIQRRQGPSSSAS